MKQSLFIQTDNDPALRTPVRGINATVKSSMIFQSGIKSSTFLPTPSSYNEKLMREFASKPQNLLENPTTYDNSLAKPNKVSKSMIKLNLLHSSGKSNNHSHSQSKRKKFISVTQRGQQPKILSSQKKNQLVTQKPPALQQKPKPPTHINPFSTFRQLLTPANTLKQYWSTMIQTLSNGGSKVESQQQAQENIMNEDVLPNHKDFCVAEKARMERKMMMNSLIFSETSRRNNGRAHTEMEEYSPMRREHILITEPECPVDSRNFAVFEEKIGQNTLTRKDSLILALMDELENLPDEIKQKEQQANEEKIMKQMIPCVNNRNEFQSTKKYQNLIGRQSQQQQLPQQTDRKKVGSIKGNRIKCISLIEKQQSYKYKNTRNQSELQEQFIEMKKKTSKKT